MFEAIIKKFKYTFLFLISVVVVGNASAQVHDTLFVEDNPIVVQLDSLATSIFYKNSNFTTDVVKLNKYGYAADYIPIFNDSIYRNRISDMGINSPFEYVYNQQVRNYIDLYSIKKRKLVSRMLGLAEIYFPLFEEQLDKHNVPLELKYLAIIESALNPIAKSRAGASGLWQFMLTTGKLYGLKVTSYVDDRCDPYKATVAACEHLRDLYNIYHDWAIVLAAYNAGAGNINRAIRTANLDTSERVTYWKIQKFLPKETQNYVPAFIGASYVMTYATEHNLYPIQPPIMHCDIDTITVTKNYNINQIASYLCLPDENIKFLNPAYKKGVIPATKENPYVLCLPREYIDEFMNNEFAIYNYKSLQETEYQVQLNKMSETKTAPSPVISSMSGQNTQTAVKTQNNTPTNTVSQPKPNTSVSNTSKYIYHTVQRGDSLWSIANRYKGVSVEDIRKLNNLAPQNIIHPGQKLKINIKG